jgi:segregation and condensation protein A
MEEHDVTVATEFMVLAATLIEIKSKMILPRVNETGDAVIEEDPRTALVERILEYKRFKKAADILAAQEERSQRIFEKPQEDISQYLENPDEYLSLDLKQFAGAFNLFIQKKQKVEAVRKHYTKIERERETMESRIRMILNKVRTKIGEIFSFRDLVKNKEDRYDVVVTFMSLLEMAKERVVSVNQKSLYGDIEVSAGERVDEDSVLEKYQDKEVQEV